MDRRRALIDGWLAEHELDHILVYGFYWAGNAVGFFTGWPVTAEAAVVFTRGATPAMYVQFYNHVPEATQIAYQTEVGPGSESTIGTAIETMEKRGKPNPRVGVIGPLPMGAYRALEARTSEIVDLNRAYGGRPHDQVGRGIRLAQDRRCLKRYVLRSSVAGHQAG